MRDQGHPARKCLPRYGLAPSEGGMSTAEGGVEITGTSGEPCVALMARAGQDHGELVKVSPQSGLGYTTLLYTK